MSKPHDNHQQHVVLDCVDDPVVADADAQTPAAPESTCARWSRVLGEQGDRALNATTILGVFQGRHQLLVALRTHQHPSQVAPALHKHGFGAGSLHRARV